MIRRRSRDARVDRASKRAAEMFSDGCVILDAAPATNAEARDWVSQVESWIERSSRQLAAYSAKASAQFLRDPENLRDTQLHRIDPALENEYRKLRARLVSLRSILARPEAYLQ